MNIEKVNKLKENFKLRNIEVSYFDTYEELKTGILNSIPLSFTVGIGHSATLSKLDITSSLLKRGNIEVVLKHWQS